MVDVASKDVTVRTARASGRVLLSARAVAALRDGPVPKGDALAVARIAGIAGAKRTPDLIPLCHPLGLHGVSVDVAVEDWGVAIEATVRTADRTGVEMEALTSVSVAALTLIDMIKSVDKAAVITDVRLESKAGQARVAVTDHGIGIPREQQERIFSRFYQAESVVRSRRFGGMGLGLFISKSIIDEMGGTIGVESAIGQGSTFHFELPLHKA